MNKFIVFEGLDACGKTTLSSRYAKDRNTVVHSAVVSEANDLKKRIDSNKSKESALLFFLLNNFLRSEEVKTEQKFDDIVFDRYIFSTLAYQSILLDEERVKQIFEALRVTNKLLLPDVIVFVKADLETINRRIGERGGELQWYGDEVTQNNSVETAYKEIFSWFNIPIVEVDTSDKLGFTVEENYQQMTLLIDRAASLVCEP
ncbi:deoxynucleoside kinase [Vibrio sp. 16]|uniref:deoxynucleoside kinase n=1 Tax=Vibrio sp. 16 TaxID=391586 RepID=UPI002FEEE07B